MMSSPWKKKQPEVVAEMVLKRAEISKMARKLQASLALAGFKAAQGWEDLTLNEIEPKMAEHFKNKNNKRPSSASDLLSDSSSSNSDFQYPRHLLSSSPMKPIFSDAVNSSNGSTGHRKRTYDASFPHPSSSQHRKRFRSSPTTGRSQTPNGGWKDQHQLAQSSPIKARKHSHFTTSAGPNISLSRGTSSSNLSRGVPTSLGTISDDEDDLLPLHSFDHIRSSPPRTPPSRQRGLPPHRNSQSTVRQHKPSEEGADLLLYLATSPSPAHARRNNRVTEANNSTMNPPSTPPSRTLALPSSMMTTPNGTSANNVYSFMPQTPTQNFDLSEFCNVTPSPAQNAWGKTPGTARTPATVRRSRLDFLSGSPNPNKERIERVDRVHAAGLGMQLGGELGLS